MKMDGQIETTNTAAAAAAAAATLPAAAAVAAASRLLLLPLPPTAPAASLQPRFWNALFFGEGDSELVLCTPSISCLGQGKPIVYSLTIL